MKRRLVAVVTGMMLVALWAAPAAALSKPEFLTPVSGEVVEGSTRIAVRSRPDPGLGGLFPEEVSIKASVPGRSEPLTLSKKDDDVHDAIWDAGGVPLNGTYELKAVATSSRDSQTSVISVKVNNPPAAPRDVKAALKDGVPHVTWAANQERDLIGYKVQRSVEGGAYSQVYAGTATSLTDSDAPHAKPLTYKVIAVRKSPVSAGIETMSGPTAAVTAGPSGPPTPAGAAPAGAAAAPDPNKPTVPGTNIVTGKENPKPAAPGRNNSFGKAIAPIVKSAPGSGGTAFDETLPYSGVPPEQFEAAGGGEPSPLDARAQAQANDGVTVTNPFKFIVTGILLLIASGLMWRTSRKLLKGTRLPEGTPPTVKYPTFRVNRG